MNNMKLQNNTILCDQLVWALQNEQVSTHFVDIAVHNFIDAIPCIPEDEITKTLLKLTDFFYLENIEKAYLAIIIAKYFLERGYQCEEVGEKLLKCMEDLLPQALQLGEIFFDYIYEQFASKAKEKEFPIKEHFNIFLTNYSKTNIKEVNVWQAFSLYSKPAISIFSIDKSARKKAKQRLNYISAIAEYDTNFASLHQLLSIPDDEMFMFIEPSEPKGFIAQVSGVVNNFQLQEELIKFFPNPNYKPRLDGKIEGFWNLYDWKVMKYHVNDWVSFKSTDTWIWGEGSPNDIPYWRNHRVVLLEKPCYTRIWSANDTFPLLETEILVQQILTPSFIAHYLEEMRSEAKKLK